MAQYRQSGFDRVLGQNGGSDHVSIGIRASNPPHKQSQTVHHRRFKARKISIGALVLILSVAFVVSVSVFLYLSECSTGNLRYAHIAIECSTGNLNDDIADKPSSSDQSESEYGYRPVQQVRIMPLESTSSTTTLKEEELLDAMLLLYHLGLAPNFKQV